MKDDVPTTVVEEYVTADEDDEKQLPDRFVDPKIAKLKNQGKTESVESFASVMSEVDVSMKDYYKIRHENRMDSVDPSEDDPLKARVYDSMANPTSSLSIKSGIEKVRTCAKDLGRQDTANSQLDVTEKDYYQIRYQSEVLRDADDPVEQNNTDNESVPCAENDFMTEKEFDHAYRTDVKEEQEGPGGADINVRNSSIDVEVGQEDQDDKGSEVEELEGDEGDEEYNTESVNENLKLVVKVDDYDPGLGPSSRARCKRSDKVFGTNLAGQVLSAPQFLDVEDKTEEISNISDLDKDDPITDHEHISGPEDDEATADKTEYSLPKETVKVTRMRETEDGTVVISEEQGEHLVIKEEVSMDQFIRETENASPLSDHFHLTEDEMDDIPRDFSLANPVDAPYLKKEFEERRRSSVSLGCKHSHVIKQLQSSSRKNSACADIIRTQIIESGVLDSQEADEDDGGDTSSEQLETHAEHEEVDGEGTDYATAIDEGEGGGGDEDDNAADIEEEEEDGDSSPTKKNKKAQGRRKGNKGQRLCPTESEKDIANKGTAKKSPKKKGQKKKGSK